MSEPFSDAELESLCDFYKHHHADPNAEMNVEWLLAICERLREILASKRRPGRKRSRRYAAALNVQTFMKQFGWSQEEARRVAARWEGLTVAEVGSAHRYLLKKIRSIKTEG